MNRTFLITALLSLSLSGMQVMEIPPAERITYPQEKALILSKKYGPVIWIDPIKKILNLVTSESQ